MRGDACEDSTCRASMYDSCFCIFQPSCQSSPALKKITGAKAAIIAFRPKIRAIPFPFQMMFFPPKRKTAYFSEESQENFLQICNFKNKKIHFWRLFTAKARRIRKMSYSTACKRLFVRPAPVEGRDFFGKTRTLAVVSKRISGKNPSKRKRRRRDRCANVTPSAFNLMQKTTKMSGFLRQITLNAFGGCAAFMNRPHHERLPAPHIARRKYARHGCHAVRVRGNVAALIEFHA